GPASIDSLRRRIDVAGQDKLAAILGMVHLHSSSADARWWRERWAKFRQPTLFSQTAENAAHQGAADLRTDGAGGGLDRRLDRSLPLRAAAALSLGLRAEIRQGPAAAALLRFLPAGRALGTRLQHLIGRF